MDLSERLKSLPGLDKPALCKLWSELFKELVPVGVRRELVVRILAYRLQEQAFGDLSPASHRRLRQIAAHIESGKANPTAEPQRIKAGTRLIREWQGKKHIVTAAQTGYEYHVGQSRTGCRTRLLRNGSVICEGKGEAPRLPERRFCVLDGAELREGEGLSKAVQASANAAAKWGAPRTFIIRFKL